MDHVSNKNVREQTNDSFTECLNYSRDQLKFRSSFGYRMTRLSDLLSFDWPHGISFHPRGAFLFLDAIPLHGITYITVAASRCLSIARPVFASGVLTRSITNTAADLSPFLSVIGLT